MKNQEQILKLALRTTDALNKLNALLEKINLLTDELAGTSLAELDLHTDTASHELQVAKIKADMVRHFVLPSVEIAKNLSADAHALFEALKVG